MLKKIKLVRHLPAQQSAPCAAAIGNFDGLHLGHQKVITQLVQKAKALHLIPTVITFEPLPQTYLTPQKPVLRLCSLRQKIRLLSEYGIEQVFCIRFNAKFAQCSAFDFIQKYLIDAYQVRYLVVGEDFRFGHQKQGDIHLLKSISQESNFTVEPLPIEIDKENHQKMSSTAIRAALGNGDVDTVTRLLGRNFSLSQRVQKGAQRGRLLGFPTANFVLNKAQEALFKGVFLTQVTIDNKQYDALTNVGTRPTVDGENYVAETHILSFNGNLYGKRIEVAFLQKIRDEKKFANSDVLKQQIYQDIQHAQALRGCVEHE